MQIPKIETKIDKKFLLFKIIAFELVPVNSKYFKENTCHRQSMF